MADSGNHLMVAALDFGTTYSGYSFSMRDEFVKDPLKIQANPVWKAGSRQFMSMKTPTCLLLDGKREFVAFGYDAENQWADLLLDGEHEEYYYFERFKMNLHNNKNITSGMLLEDVTEKKQLPAFDVFKLSIQYLVNHLLDVLKNQGNVVRHNEVRWVLTVPAIWTDRAKKFMRACAEAAGIPKDNLFLALEPETASIFCQYLSTEKLKGSEPGFTMTSEGTEYMVVDLGGGTADITVHKKVANGQLKEKHRAIGNDCGGTSIDKRFFEVFEEIFGNTIINLLKKECPLAYLDLVREFESQKRAVETSNKTKVTMAIPFVALDEMCQKSLQKNLKSLLENSPYSKEIMLTKGGKIRISVDFFKMFFMPSIEGVISLMREIFRNKSLKNVAHVLIVGGFSECKLMQDAVRNAFPDQRIINPNEAGLSVLKGAVLFGHKPDYIQSRVMRCSYGVKTNLPWNEKKYDRKHYVLMDGEERCDDIFSLIVEKNESVEAGMIVKKSFFTPFKHQVSMDIMVYVSEEATPGYVDDDTCYLLCKPTITFIDTCEDRRWVDVEFVLGNTEIDLKAHDRNSGKAISAKFNLI
ncbi:heat shock 70 kDa protein 12A-like isoform X1 [Mytilus galloprovincialis]|uniref:heat shock 70 kDa protein 12A-like isoform X1 n=1 Tax=Mytilus galloprovincialis TaxID=29158 RepID=UPI003F7B3A36